MPRRLLIVSLLIPFFWTFARSAGGEEGIAPLRARLAELGRLQIEMAGRIDDALPRELGRKDREMTSSLQKEPKELLLRAIHLCLEGDDAEEIIGAAGMYSLLVYNKKTSANPAYRPILLEKLARDDLGSREYTRSLAGALRLYPSRETVLAYKALADRSPTLEMRVDYTKAAASMLGMWLEIYTNSTPEQVDKALAGFDAWFAKNKERIHFDKKGKLRLSRGGGEKEPAAGLSGEDRERIRGQAACVLRLMNATLGGEDGDSGNPGAEALNARCGPALFGAERSAAMAKMAEEAENERTGETAEEGAGSGEGALETQGRLQAAGDYPTVDAALLAAVYVVSYESDPEALRLAEDLLDRASRADVKRVSKGEPAGVRKKALALAGNP